MLDEVVWVWVFVEYSIVDDPLTVELSIRGVGVVIAGAVDVAVESEGAGREMVVSLDIEVFSEMVGFTVVVPSIVVDISAVVDVATSGVVVVVIVVVVISDVEVDVEV